MADDICNHVDCDALADVERVHVESGTVYRYCEAHDPLEDDAVADYFEAVD